MTSNGCEKPIETVYIPISVSNLDSETLNEWVKNEIKETQNGYFDRSNFPEEWIAEIAKSTWHDSKFSYGMEYGYLLAMHNIQLKLEAME